MKLPSFAISTSSIVNVIGTAVIIYLLVVLAGTVKRNYDLDRQIHDMQSQITLLQDQKDKLNYDIQYYNTNSFRDREARSKLGLQLPGENVVIVPHPSTSPAAPKPAADTTAKTGRSNLQQWLSFLSGRS